MTSSITNLEDITNQLQTFKNSLANRLNQLKPNPQIQIPKDYKQRMQGYKQIVKRKSNQTNFIDILLSKVQGRTVDLNNILKELVNQYGGEESEWKGKLRQYFELKNYGFKETKMQVWEVRAKYLNYLKDYYNIPDLVQIRKNRQNNKKMIKDLNQLIDKISKSNKSEESEIQIKELYLRLLNQQFKQKLQQQKNKITKKKIEPLQINQQKITPGKERETSADDASPLQKKMDIQISDQQKKQNNAQLKNIILDDGKTTPQNKISNKQQSKNFSPIVQEPQKNNKLLNIQQEKSKVKNTKKIDEPVKPNNQKNHKIMDFFTLKKKVKQQQKIIEQANNVCQQQLQNFISQINIKQKNIEELKNQFSKQDKMQIQEKEKMNSRFVYINIWDSYYYFRSFQMNEQIIKNCVSPLNPQIAYQQINYVEQSEQQYKLFIQILDNQYIQKEEEKSVQSDSQSGNNTILDDDHLSSDQLISQSDSIIIKNNPITKLDRGQKWQFQNNKQQLRWRCLYAVVSMQQDIKFPLPMKQVKQKIKGNQKIQFIKIIHGSFQKGDDLVQKLKIKLSQMTKNRIKNYMNEISIKQKGRRLIKPYFIQQNKQKLQEENINLNDIALQRQMEYNQTNKIVFKTEQKIQFFKILHGSYDKFEKLVEQVKTLLPYMPKSQIKNNINQISSKQQGRRIIKKEVLAELEQILTQKNINPQDLLNCRQKQKVQQKQRKQKQKAQQKNLNKLQLTTVKAWPLLGDENQQNEMLIEKPNEQNIQIKQQKVVKVKKNKSKKKKSKKNKKSKKVKKQIKLPEQQDQQEEAQQLDQDDDSYHPV